MQIETQKNENTESERLYLCVQKKHAIKQRDTEISRGQGLEGTWGYEQAGCYECSGHNQTCPAFYGLN